MQYTPLAVVIDLILYELDCDCVVNTPLKLISVIPIGLSLVELHQRNFYACIGIYVRVQRRYFRDVDLWIS